MFHDNPYQKYTYQDINNFIYSFSVYVIAVHSGVPLYCERCLEYCSTASLLGPVSDKFLTFHPQASPSALQLPFAGCETNALYYLYTKT